MTHREGASVQRSSLDQNSPAALDVVAGVIFLSPDYLVLAERADKRTGKVVWEFPGGKVEQGETHAEALERELGEELGVVTKTLRWLYTSAVRTHTPLDVAFYLSQIVEGVPIPREHQSVKIVRRSALEGHAFHDADLEFVRFLSRQKPGFLQ